MAHTLDFMFDKLTRMTTIVAPLTRPLLKNVEAFDGDYSLILVFTPFPI